jgi:hypothetical protein
MAAERLRSAASFKGGCGDEAGPLGLKASSSSSWSRDVEEKEWKDLRSDEGWLATSKGRKALRRTKEKPRLVTPAMTRRGAR